MCLFNLGTDSSPPAQNDHMVRACRFTVPMSHAGSVEKSRQRRSRHFPVLTYSAYAPRVQTAAALLDGPFGQTQDMLF